MTKKVSTKIMNNVIMQNINYYGIDRHSMNTLSVLVYMTFETMLVSAYLNGRWVA